MAIQLSGNEYRTTLLQIDAYENRIPVGCLSNPSLEGPVPFRGTVELLCRMGELLDRTALPQSFTAVRSFGPPAVGAPAAAEETVPGGKLATFAVRVLFRQNASWQGSVTWVDTGREQSFRSVLELLLLMDGALSQEDA